MGRARMERKTNFYNIKRKARERRQAMLEIARDDCSCGLREKKEHKAIPKRVTKFTHLPEEIVLEIVSYLALKDVLAVNQVSKYHHGIIQDSPMTWAKLSFHCKWPNAKNMKTFKKAAECGNIECLAKLAFVSLYIYNFKAGVRKCVKTSEENAKQAVYYFSKIDASIAPELPLTWMFIRPPWAYPGGVRKCLKECMLNKIEENCSSPEVTTPALYNVGRAYLLKEDALKDKAVEFFTKAAEMGCAYSKWELYKLQFCNDDDAGVLLEKIRRLQDVASRGHFHATIELCKEYSLSMFGNVNRKTAVEFFRKVFNQSNASGIHKITSKSNCKINENMRCILINWMHEVCDVKSIESEAIHMAVDCLDRFLLKRSVTRKQLQLIGISCVVLASKAFSSSSSTLLTIRESAWLTDSTYEYNEVVRMLAEIIGALSGKLVRMNTNHYGQILSTLAKLDDYKDHFLNYLLDSTLQFCDFGRFKQSLIAASAIMLTNIVHKSGDVWPARMAEFTGYDVKDLANCVALLYSKCLLDNKAVVDGEHQISGARDRYSTPEFMEVAKRTIPDIAVVRSCIEDLDPRLRCTQENDLLFFYFKDDKNILDPVDDISATSSFLCGYDGDEEDNQSQSTADISLFSVKDQHRPTLDGFVPEVFSEETSKYSPGHFITDCESDLGVTELETDDCTCSPLKPALEPSGSKELSMEKLSAVFSTACSCSGSISKKFTKTEKGNECKGDVKRRPQAVKCTHFSMCLRSCAQKSGYSKSRGTGEETNRELRKRPANRFVFNKGKSEFKGLPKPKIDRKSGKEQWRY